MIRAPLATAALALAFAAAGCGQKGPLKLPDPPKQEPGKQEPAKPAPSTP